MELKVVKYETEEYKKMIELRNEILLVPIGLPYYQRAFESDPQSLHCVCFEAGEAVGCCVLTPVSDELVQLRQMAVSSELQGIGVGTKVITFAETVAKENGFKEIMLQAQRVAEGFYLKSGYHFVGEEFEEVGRPHMEMRKKL